MLISKRECLSFERVVSHTTSAVLCYVLTSTCSSILIVYVASCFSNYEIIFIQLYWIIKTNYICKYTFIWKNMKQHKHSRCLNMLKLKHNIKLLMSYGKQLFRTTSTLSSKSTWKMVKFILRLCFPQHSPSKETSSSSSQNRTELTKLCKLIKEINKGVPAPG
jgi:hypothetical protein